MRIMHLSDLHFGKKYKIYSFIEDQKDIVNKIIDMVKEYQIDTVLIAGDIYDTSLPSIEAINVFDDFLVRLSQLGVNTLVSSGNHDSADRLAFGRNLMEKNNVYISPVYAGEVAPITILDAYGPIHFYLLPFVKPLHVKHYDPDQEFKDYTDAVQYVIDKMHINKNERNIILSHQYVNGATLDGSEEMIGVGGLDLVEAHVYEDFDYTALGHIHRPQNVKGKTIRYCGTPMKFSFSEEKQNKTITIFEMKEKGSEIEFTYVPIEAKHDFITVKGTFSDILAQAKEDEDNRENYIHIILSDEDMISDAYNILSQYYHRIMGIEYDNERQKNIQESVYGYGTDDVHPMQLFKDFFQDRYGKALDEEQESYMQKVYEEIWEGKE